MGCWLCVEATLADADEKQALATIQAKGDEVLSSVLSQLADDQAVLRGELNARIEAYSQASCMQRTVLAYVTCTPCSTQPQP